MINLEENQKSSTRRLFRKLYYKTPLYIQNLFSPVRYIANIINSLKLHQWIITGTEILSKEELKIFFAGRIKDKNFFTKLAFSNSCNEMYMGKKWIWNIPQIINKNDHNCSVFIMEVHKSFRNFFKSDKYFYIPSWVQGEVDISDCIHRFTSKSFKYYIRKLRKNNLYYEITNELSELYNFYHNMYLPYITRRYNNTAYIIDYDFVKQKFSNCDLLLIKNKKEIIAGELIIYQKNSARLWLLGVKDGNYDFVKSGLLGSRYFFSLNYLKEKGYKRVNLGSSRAFLKDGALQFKKHWDFNIIDKFNNGFLLEPINNTGGVLGFFMNNPFIYYSIKEGFIGAIFIKDKLSLIEEDIKKIYKNFFIKGIYKIYIFIFEEDDFEKHDLVPDRLCDKMEIRSVKDYLN